MLSIDEKKEIFKEFLLLRNDSYADMMKDEIYFCFFENEWNFGFLDELYTSKEILDKVDNAITKMIMREHEEGLKDIISFEFCN